MKKYVFFIMVVVLGLVTVFDFLVSGQKEDSVSFKYKKTVDYNSPVALEIAAHSSMDTLGYTPSKQPVIAYSIYAPGQGVQLLHGHRQGY